MADRTTIIHPAWLRAMHWTNAAAMTVMVLSGWQIYDASPIFAFRFSHSITLGGWLGGGLLWHFAAMWVLMLNGALYLIFGLASGRFRRKLFPISPSGVLHERLPPSRATSPTTIWPSTARFSGCCTSASCSSESSSC